MTSSLYGVFAFRRDNRKISFDLVSSQASDIKILGSLDKPREIVTSNFDFSFVHKVHNGEEVFKGEASDVDIALALFRILQNFPEERTVGGEDEFVNVN